jgi:hypothetical protein
MNFAPIVGFSVISLFSVAFIVRCYRAATPAQRPLIIVAAGGAVAVATLIGLMIGWR